MEKKVIITDVKDFFDKMKILSKNVVKPVSGSGFCTLYFRSNQLIVCAKGISSFGYIMTQTKEKWMSPFYLVNQTMLTNIAALLPKDQSVILVFEESGIISFSSVDGTVNFKMRAGHAKDSLPKIKSKEAILASFDLKKEDLDAIQQKVLPAADTADSSLCSVGFVADESRCVNLFATNRYVLSQMKTGITAASPCSIATSLDAWRIPSANNSLHYDVTKEFTFVTGEGFKFAFNNLEAQLPPFSKLLEKVTENSFVEMKKADVKSALERIDLLANVGKEQNPVEAHFGEKHVTLFTKLTSLGSVTAIAAITSHSPAINGKKIAFSLSLLQKGVEASDDTVKMFFDTNAKNFALNMVKMETSKNSVMLVAPMRTKDGFTDLDK